MTDDVHPALDALADLHAGLTEPVDKDRLTTHLATCTSCTAALAALDEVAGLLASVAEQPPAMPADVGNSLDAQLRRLGAERDAGVPSLAERRAGADGRTPPDRSRWSRRAVLGAAATVLAVTGVWGVAHLGLGSSSSMDNATSDSGGSAAEDSASMAGSADAPAEEQQSPLPGGAPKRRGSDADPRRLDPQSLAGYAAALARRDPAADATHAESCPTRGVLVTASTAEPRPAASSPVRWRGNLAVVLVRPHDRRAVVFSCEPPARRLYSTRY